MASVTGAQNLRDSFASWASIGGTFFGMGNKGVLSIRRILFLSWLECQFEWEG